MRCSKCGRENISPGRFCQYCGTPMQVPDSTPGPDVSDRVSQSVFPAAASPIPPSSDKSMESGAVFQKAPITLPPDNSPSAQPPSAAPIPKAKRALDRTLVLLCALFVIPLALGIALAVTTSAHANEIDTLEAERSAASEDAAKWESEAHDKEDLLTGLESQAEERQQEVDSVSSQLETAQPKADFWDSIFLADWMDIGENLQSVYIYHDPSCPLCTEAEDIDYFFRVIPREWITEDKCPSYLEFHPCPVCLD